MAGPRIPSLLLILLSSALGSAGQSTQETGERIINGVPCPRGAQPWQVALYQNNVFQCAGVLVHQQWVLTVAHCRRSDYVVHMGGGHPADGCAKKIRATESFVHPEFDNRTHDDIMLVKLSSPDTLSPNVKTIDLPSDCKGSGTSCTVSGWGFTSSDLEATIPSKLMCANVNIISYKECMEMYPRDLSAYVLCAAPPDGLSNSCKGDSGSPLICEGSLQGLVSTGLFPCRPPFEPVIYTRICMYNQWIRDTITANS